MKLQEHFYKILDTPVVLQTDIHEFFQSFDNDFREFRTSKLCGESSFFISTNRLNSGNMLNLSIHKNREEIFNENIDIQMIYQIVLRKILEEQSDYFFIHGGVVVKDNRALIISGKPSSGKTTLTLELLKEGFSFFSDEFCPVHKESHLIYPFPRSVFTSNKIDKSNLSKNIKKDLFQRKSVSVIEELNIDVGKQSVKPKSLIFLSYEKNNDQMHYLKVIIKKKKEQDFCNELKGLGVSPQVTLKNGFSIFHVRYLKKRKLTLVLKRILYKYKKDVLDTYTLHQDSPDFSEKPTITPIPPHSASQILLENLKSDTLFQSGESLSREACYFYMKLYEFLTNLVCYKLKVGKLKEMIDLINSAWSCN